MNLTDEMLSERSQTLAPGVAQSVKRQALGFGSGLDLTVCEIEPCIGLCADSVEPARDSLCPSLSAPPLLSVSQKINRPKKKKKKKKEEEEDRHKNRLTVCFHLHDVQKQLKLICGCKSHSSSYL